MTDLTPQARALIKSGRSALRATSADRERIETALRTRLGAEALPHAGGVARAASSASWQVGAGVATLCALGALGYFALQPSAPAPKARVPAAATPAPLASDGKSTAWAVTPLRPPPTAADIPVPVTPAPAVVSAAPTPASALPRVQDRLAREVALLSRATSALRAGHAAAALKTLGEHQRSFPQGALSEERRAAKAQALCVLGRMREGRAELAQLKPGSPAAARAEQVCATEPAAAADRK